MLGTFLKGATTKELELVGFSVFKRSTVGRTMTVDVPSGTQPGDLLVMSGVSSAASGSLSSSDDFTISVNSSFRFGGYLTSWDGIKSSYTFTYSSNGVGHLSTIYAFRNAEIDAFGDLTTSAAQNPVLPAITLSSGRNIVLAICSNLTSGTFTAGFQAPSGFSEVTSVDGGGAARRTTFIQENRSSGSTGNITVDATGSATTNRGFLVGIKRS